MTWTVVSGWVQSAESRLLQHFWSVVVFLTVADCALAYSVVASVPYTEIDWRAYMQEVAGVIVDGEFDYVKLRGDTGPLVYPAGFVYVYSILFYLTEGGRNIHTAQLLYCVLHAACFVAVAAIYYQYYVSQPSCASTQRLPLWSALLLLVSRRVMSLFVLRLFNEGVQILLMYIAIALLASNRWMSGCLVFSASVSIKMNALLYAPGLAVVLCQALGPIRALAHIVFVCGGFQVFVGAPFLLHASSSYLSKAFEFNRVFMYKWSVNGAFLPEEVFLDRRLACFLLGCHLLVLLLFGHLRWTSASSGGLLGLLNERSEGETRWHTGKGWWTWASQFKTRHLRASHVIHCMFSCNLVGIAFARTLHYQFYLWYFHTLPLLIFTTGIPAIVGLSFLLAIEVAFNVYPPRPSAALALSTSHIFLILALWTRPPRKDDDIYQTTFSPGEIGTRKSN